MDDTTIYYIIYILCYNKHVYDKSKNTWNNQEQHTEIPESDSIY